MEKPFSKFQLVLFCLDVTAYHVAKNIPTWNDWQLEQHAQKFAVAMMLVFWMTLISIAGHFVQFGEYDFARYMTLCFVIEFILALGCQKKVAAIEAEYSQHYSPMIWIVFVVFMISTIAYWLNSQIGHLPAAYKHS